MIKAIFFTISLIFLSSCNKTEDVTTVKTGVETISVGQVKFGKVILGEYREAVIRFTNYGPNAITNFNPATELSAPFSVSSITPACNGGTIPVSIVCELKIKFAPTTQGTWTQSVTIGDKTHETSGQGLDARGVVEFSTSNFALGTVIAGETVFQDLVLTNQGNFAVSTPLPVNMPTGVLMVNNACGSYMAPNKVCTIRFSIYKSTVGVSSTYFQMRSPDIDDYTINVIATTNPGAPAGTIAFLSPPTSVIADGTDTKTITTAPIRDQFNNIVSDGQPITILTFNLNLLTPMIVYTSNGQVSFSVRATTLRGESTITLVGGATGFLRMPSLAGPPVGVISAPGFINTVNANGITQIDFRTDSLTDQFGNVVEDNTPVTFSLAGGGSLQSFTLYTVLGKVQQLITAPTSVGTSVLTVSAGTVTPSSICGFGACGSFNLYFIPSDPFGTIPVNPTHSGIFADPALGLSLGELIQTVVNIGPVKDEYNNLVATGTTLTLNLENGVNVFNTQLTTDANGMASFTLAGTGTRGPIKINVSKLTASGNAEVWGYKTTTIRADSPGLPTSAYKLYLSYFNDSSFPALTGNWGEIKNWGNIDIQDNNFYGDRKKSAPPTLIVRSSPSEIGIHPSSKIPSFKQPCLFSSGNVTYAGGCLLDSYNGQFSSSYQFQFRKTVADDGGSNMITEAINAHNLSLHHELKEGCYAVDTQPSSPTLGLLAIIDDMSQANCGVVNGLNPSGIGRWNSNPDSGCYAQDLNITSPTYGMIKFLSSSSGGCGTDIQTSMGNYFNVGQLPLTQNYLKYSFRGYIPDLDKLLVFGGYSIIPYITGFGVFNVTDLSNKSTWLLNKGAGNTFSETELMNPNGELGDYPEKTAFSQTANSSRHLFVFGGLDLQSSIFGGTSVSYAATRPNDRFYMYNGNTSKWNELSPSNDNSVINPNESSTPFARYQHGMVYIPDNNTLFLGSGKALITSMINPSGVWSNANDLWSVQLDDLNNLSWKRECFPCGFPATAHYHPNTLTSESQLVPKDLRMTWNPYLQRVIMLWNGTINNLQFFNPFQNGIKTILNESYSFNSGGTNIVDENLEQIEFNADLGRTFFYKKNPSNPNASNMYYWDMDETKKQYYKVEINLGGASAKNYVRDLQIRMRGYGKITNLSNITMSSGLTAQIFNHQTQAWEFMATNNADESFISSNYLNQDYSSSVSANYVGNDGKISIIVYPNGTTSVSSFNEVFIDEVYVSGTF
jgi:hypothetical protein